MPEFTVVVPEKNIEAYVAEQMNALETYKDSNAYRDAQKKELEKIIAGAKKELKKAVTKKEADAIATAAKTAMDKVKTDAQLTEEENSQQKPGTIVPPVQAPDSTPQTPVVNQPQKKAKIAKVKVKAKAGRKTAKLSRKKYSFIDTKVKRNTKYFYKICAYKKVNGKKVNGPFSKIVVVRVK